MLIGYGKVKTIENTSYFNFGRSSIRCDIPKTEVFYIENDKNISLELYEDLAVMGHKDVLNEIRSIKLFFNPDYEELWHFIEKVYMKQPFKDKPLDKMIQVVSRMSDIDKDFESFNVNKN